MDKTGDTIMRSRKTSAATHSGLWRACAGLVAALALAGVAGCEPQSRGFALPPGDAERGQAEFVALGCNGCHSVAGVDKLAAGGHPDIHVVLGGQVTRVKTYGDLVTSIINPSHRLSRGNDPTTMDEAGASRMRLYNDVMTVSQLIDLTAFLQSKYEVWVPDYHMYAYP